MKKGFLFILVTFLLSCNQNHERIKVTALSPNSNDGLVACKDFEEHWTSVSDTLKVLDHFYLNGQQQSEIKRILDDVNYEELIGGYSPVYKFQLEGDVYCVTPFGNILKNDSLLAKSYKLNKLLESEERVQLGANW